MPFDGLNLTGKNFAPIKPLQDAKRVANDPKSNPSSVNAIFRELWQGYSTENEAAWREVILQGQTVANCRAGKLVMKRDLIGTGYVFVKPLSSNRGRDRSNFPVFPSISETLKSKWERANPQVKARHFGDGYKTEIQLSSIDTVIASYFKDCFGRLYKLRENLSAQDYGVYITQFEYDVQLNQMMQLAPIIQNQSKVMVDGYGACMDCGNEGHPDDFAKTGAPYPQCPECGSFKTTSMVPDTIADQAVITGVEEIVQGDLCARLRDFPASRYDPSVLPHESGHFLYSEYMPLRLIHQMFGEELEINAGEAEDIGLQVMDALAGRGGNIENLGENNTNNVLDRFADQGILQSMWLKPETYAGYKLDKPEDTLAGRIPADVPFEQIWPEGVCVRGFNDMAIQVALLAEEANLASGVYMLMSHSGIGKGVDDVVDIAKDLNELHSMGMAGIKRYAASGLAIDKNSGLTQQDVKNLFNPRKAVFVDTSQNQGDINRSIMQLHTQPVNPVIPQYAIQLSNLINMASMTGDFSQGLVQDVDINTFGGQQLAHAKTEEQKGAILTMLSEHRELSATILYKLFRKHIKMPRFYTMNQDKHGPTRGKWISGADMPKDLKFDVVPDSEISENKFEKQLKAQEMTEKAGGLMAMIQAAQVDPRMTAWYARMYGIELPLLDEEEVQLVCLSRLGDIKELSEMFQDPREVLASLSNKLQVYEDAHLPKAEFLRKMLDDDEVQGWNPVAMGSVQLLIDTHYQMEAQAQVRVESIKQSGMNQLAAQQEAANQEIARPQVEAAQAAEGQNAALGALQEVAGRVLDDEQSQVDHDRQEESAEKAHGRQMDMERQKAALNPAPAKSSGKS